MRCGMRYDVCLFLSRQLENTSSLHYQFYQNQFWKAVKLFGNIALLKGTFVGGDKQMKELAVDGLLNRYLVMSLQNLPPSVANVEKLSLVCVCVCVCVCVWVWVWVGVYVHTWCVWVVGVGVLHTIKIIYKLCTLLLGKFTYFFS